jgi:hypothetical protein
VAGFRAAILMGASKNINLKFTTVLLPWIDTLAKPVVKFE